jgi:hypothetical protein
VRACTDDLKSPSHTNNTIEGGLAIWNWLLSILGSLAVDRIGRRPIWLFATSGMLLSYVIVTALSATFDRTSDRATGLAVIPMIFVTFGL